MAHVKPELTHFLNVDLDLKSAVELDLILTDFQPKAFVLHPGDPREVTLELNGQGRQSVDATVTEFCNLIFGLSPAARAVWDGCVRRRFSVGIKAGVNQASFGLSGDTVANLAEVGAELDITIYPA